MTSEQHPPATIDKALLGELVSGACKIFDNAETLYKEAFLLRDAGFVSHAFFLHQISLEECAKIEMLSGSVMSMLMGHDIDLDKLTKALASHAHKNRANAYFLESSEAEKAARESGDFERSSKIFKEMQQDFHLKMNAAKNASLYVDFRNGQFIAPNECITPELLAGIVRLNEKHLSISSNSVKLLRKCEQKPDRFSVEALQYRTRMEELKSKLPDDPIKAWEILLQEMEPRFKAILQSPGTPVEEA